MTLSQPKTPEPIVTTFKWCDYVGDIYHQKNLFSVHPGVFAAHIGEMYIPLFACLLFLVFLLAYRRVRWTDFYS